MKNYKKIEENYIDEIQSKITIYEHIKTKAKICTIENDDDNKVFTIAFRTPPKDNSGLTHILEHSVLCGSKKYPVKDPFVELLKSSLNTFLNAMTYPDKTVYPCASLNDKDFKNLMSVYMDAVLYPQIYNHKEIFMQEGWHYEINDDKSPITLNGVVYNEMKGAFSDPRQMLFEKIFNSLYPDNCYSYVSGGDPKYIPSLSYEEFIDFHSKYYHPSNSYIFIYGNCDMKERLSWLDNEYLSKFDYKEIDTTISYQNSFDKPKYINYYYPVEKKEEEINKTFLSYNISLPIKNDMKKILAMNVLTTVLFDTPGAPIKQKLIDAKLGDDVSSMLETELLQPILSFIVTNSTEDKEEEFVKIVNDALRDIADMGIDKKGLLSIINYAEFKARERNFNASNPQGLSIELDCLNSWLYDDNTPYLYLNTLKYYKELKEEINNGYFENLIRELLLNNNHKTFVKLIPSSSKSKEDEEDLVEKLAQYKQSLTNDEIRKLIDENIKLKEYQDESSTKEEIDTLPKLKESDISDEPEKLNLDVINGKYKTLFSDYKVNGISYVRYYFDISHINDEDFQYANLFTKLFCHLSTLNHNYLELNQLIQNNTGGIYASIQMGNKVSDNESKIYLTFNYSCLTELVKYSNDLMKDMIFNATFDEKRILERLNEIKANIDMSLISRGHSTAMIRSNAHIMESSYYNDLSSGIAFRDFIHYLCDNYDTLKLQVIEKLKNVSSLLAKNNFTVSTVSSKEEYNDNNIVFEEFYDELRSNANYKTQVFVSDSKKEGIIIPSNVNYVARTGLCNTKYNAAALVLVNAISMDYLWMNVRVHGGAYGCMLVYYPNGLICFTSYRDPNIEKTNNVYEDVLDYIDNFNPTDEELLKYKIGTIGSTTSVLHSSAKGSVAAFNYLLGIDHEYRKNNRYKIIHTNIDELKSIKEQFKYALEYNNLCVLGNKNKIQEINKMFTNIREMKK